MGKVFIVFEPDVIIDEREIVKIPFDFDKMERLPDGSYWCYGIKQHIPYGKLYDSNFNPTKVEFKSRFPHDEEENDEPK